MKKCAVLLCAALLFALWIRFPMICYPCVQEYTQQIGNVDPLRFESLSPDFEIGADQYGRAVFKYPHRAFKTMKEMFSSGINEIQNEHLLLPLSHLNYQAYMNAGWQMTMGTDEEVKQAACVSSFLDIYENSFNK